MLKKGTYKIENIINISASLQSQKRNHNDQSQSTAKLIFKAVLSSDNSMIVSYFIDHITPGKASIIEICNNVKYPLLRKNDYVVIEYQKYADDEELIEVLLERKK